MFNVYMMIASQLIADFPTTIVDVTTELIVCAAGYESLIDQFFGHIRLADEENRVIRSELTGP